MKNIVFKTIKVVAKLGWAMEADTISKHGLVRKTIRVGETIKMK